MFGVVVVAVTIPSWPHFFFFFYTTKRQLERGARRMLEKRGMRVCPHRVREVGRFGVRSCLNGLLSAYRVCVAVVLKEDAL